MTSTAQEPARPVKAAAKTSYVILRRVEGQGVDSSVWEAQPGVNATSADAAIKQWADKHAKDGAELVAVPSRSFQVRKVKVETSTKVTLG